MIVRITILAVALFICGYSYYLLEKKMEGHAEIQDEMDTLREIVEIQEKKIEKQKEHSRVLLESLLECNSQFHDYAKEVKK